MPEPRQNCTLLLLTTPETAKTCLSSSSAMKAKMLNKRLRTKNDKERQDQFPDNKEEKGRARGS